MNDVMHRHRAFCAVLVCTLNIAAALCRTRLAMLRSLEPKDVCFAQKAAPDSCADANAEKRGRAASKVRTGNMTAGNMREGMEMERTQERVMTIADARSSRRRKARSFEGVICADGAGVVR